MEFANSDIEGKLFRLVKPGEAGKYPEKPGNNFTFVITFVYGSKNFVRLDSVCFCLLQVTAVAKINSTNLCNYYGRTFIYYGRTFKDPRPTEKTKIVNSSLFFKYFSSCLPLCVAY